MKKVLFILIAFMAIHSYGQNKSYWMKKFKSGTLYISFVRNDPKFGTHIKQYYTGSHSARLYKLKYSNGKYKLQMKNGWSNRNYVQFKDGSLYYASVQMSSFKMEKIRRSDTPKYIMSKKTFFRRMVVKN